MPSSVGSVIGSTIMAAIVIFALATSMAYMTLIERKVVGRIQVRFGPNRVGPFGFFQPLADVIKLILKEDIVPAQADRPVFTLAPMISLVVAFAAFAVIPFGNVLSVFGWSVPLRVADRAGRLGLQQQVCAAGWRALVGAGYLLCAGHGHVHRRRPDHHRIALDGGDRPAPERVLD